MPLKFVIFDLLSGDGVNLTHERRKKLELLGLDGPAWTTAEIFEDGSSLFDAGCGLGLEGVVAKSHLSPEGSRLGEG